MEYSYTKMSKNLESNNFSFKKKFGQNFITDENIVSNIVSKANLDKDTLVIEIGPGIGSLTTKLVEKAGHVLCYEIDETLKEMLFENLKANNVDIIFDDFLKRDLKEDLKKYSYKKVYVVANLPYYITTPIITKIIEDEINVDKIVVMVQKEVGDRFSAKPGTKEYNSLTIYLNYYFETKKLMNVSRNSFMPKPNVDSIVVEFDKKEKLKELKNKNLFFKLVRDSFKQKRKTLKNNLKEYNLSTIESTLKKYDFDLSVRAEQLSLDIFVDIANNLEG